MPNRSAEAMEAELRILLAARAAPDAVEVMQRVERLQQGIAHATAAARLPDAAELRFVACSMEFMHAMEAAQRRGFGREEVVAAAGFVLGVALRRAGRRLPAQSTVREAVPDILEGFRREALDAAARGTVGNGPPTPINGNRRLG